MGRDRDVVTLAVRRWREGEPPRWQEFAVDAGPDTTVLDALVDVQQRIDPGLAFRWACRVGMCGSCAVVVNGRERWACRTRLAGLDRRVELRPLYHLPVLRDLVVDLAPLTRRLRAVGGAFRPRPHDERYARVDGVGRERRRIDAAIECIGCGMCVSACGMVGTSPAFPGPAALNRAFTLVADSRDGGERWAALLDDDALGRCHGQAGCADVCPMGLAPADSIAALRRRALRRLLGAG